MSAAVFDWDGTLIDSRETLLATWRQVTAERLFAPFPVSAEDERLVMSTRGSDLFPTLSPDPAVVAGLATSFDRAYVDQAAARVRPFPGVAAMITRLRGNDIGVAVVTSKARSRYAADQLAAGLDVDVAVCGEDVASAKPDPAGISLALDRLDTDRDAAVMVGDSVVDMAAAGAAAVVAYGVGWSAVPAAELRAAGAQAVPARPAELGDLIIHRLRTRCPTRERPAP